MEIKVLDTPELLGQVAAKHAAEELALVIKEKGTARLLVSTGASQFQFFENLRTLPIEWGKIEVFHLDEYIGIDESHKASFVKYLRERFLCSLPSSVKDFTQ